MSLPAFIARAGDAALPLLEGAGHEEFIARLDATTLELRAGAAVAEPGKRIGFLLAVNLAARLYPSLIIEAPGPLAEEARALALAINPNCELATDGATVTLVFADAAAPAAALVVVDAAGWNAFIDQVAEPGPASAAAAMAAASIGMAAVFRNVFAEELAGRARIAAEPGGFNLLTLGEPIQLDVPISPTVTLGDVHLAGCGAIGQAAALTLANHSVSGTLFAVDHERTELSNAQRYLLMLAIDEDVRKPDLIRRIFHGTGIEVVSVPGRWAEDERARLAVDCVLTALDTLTDRIGVQAGLPRVIYNAWTQPGDLGWTRHERFGTEECLACLCWPPGQRRDRHLLIADALGQHPLRISKYLLFGRAVGDPLTIAEAAEGSLRHPRPPEADDWSHRSLLDDVLAIRQLAAGGEPADWAGRTVDDLYHQGICAGALLRRGDISDREMAVPLAHQSALAGVMLAAQLLVARVPELREHRSSRIEGRFDVMRPLPQRIWRPTARRRECICADDDFVARYNELWSERGRRTLKDDV